jgi:quercetin dioxygenase-like cupin family protein
VLALLQEQLPVLTRDSAKQYEQAIIDHLEPVDPPIEHAHIDGVYARKMSLNEGETLTGKIHSTEHICIVAKGRIAVRTVGEEGTKILEAGDMFVSGPGAKRIGYALEDCVFINIHTNKENDTDLAVLESKLITPELIGYDKEELWLGQQ